LPPSIKNSHRQKLLLACKYWPLLSRIIDSNVPMIE
jgi:hypothetical protein